MRRRLLALGCLAAVGLAMPVARAGGPTRSQQRIRSFDGTPIFSTLFLPPSPGPVPVVLHGPQWGAVGETEVGGHVATLLRAGYAVLTWDPRGLGRSGGTSAFDSPDVEGRDVSALVDWLSRHPAVAREAPGDPVVGMSGLSYGAAIQLAAAAVDPRIDAIAPEAAWYDLRHSLFPNGVSKLGWNNMLWQSGLRRAMTDPAEGQPGGLSLEQHRLQYDALVTDDPSPETQRWLLDRSLAGYGARRPVRVPTLVLQAATDSLFDLTEGIRILRHVRANGAPARLVAYCGGHGICLHPGDDRAHLDAAIVRWFDRFLKGDASVDVGPPAEYRTNRGGWKAAADLPPPDVHPVPARATGALITGPSVHDRSSTLRMPLLTAPAGGLELVGAPRVVLSATGWGTGGKVAVRLVHRETDEVVDNQQLPLRLANLWGTPQSFVVDLPAVAFTLPAGEHLDVHLVAGSSWYSPSRQAGVVDFDVTVHLPARS